METGIDVALAPMPADVRAAYDAMPSPGRDALLAVRALIFETAAATDGVGDLVETLKWGEPSYLPARPRTGTTVRLGLMREGRPAMFCHCQTDLIGRFRAAYGDLFAFEGNRALILPVDAPRDALAHCIAMALTYHLCRR